MPEIWTLESYAEHIRRTCGRLSGDLFGKLGVEDPSALKVAMLCEEAANIIADLQMKQEQESISDLDLTTLPQPKERG